MFAIPSLKDLVERSRRAFRVNLPGSDAWAWPNNINPTAKVIAGMTHAVFGFADYIQRQKFALTADSENLDLHGEELGLARRPTGPAQGFVKVTATGALDIAALAIFRRIDGVEYRAINGGTLVASGNVEIEVISTTEGAAVSAIAGTPLEIVSGVSGAGADSATAEVAARAIVGGVDVEDDETFRARILFRKRNPPHGGTAADYVIWASAVAGVTRVFVERRWNGRGTVRVFPLMDELFSDGIPSSPDVARVADYIDTQAPAGAVVQVSPPVARVVNVVIDGLMPSTVAVQNAVKDELRSAFRRLSRVAGTDVEIGGMPYLASPATFSRSWIWQAIANATGEERHEVTSPAADIELERTEIATLGTVTFT